MRNLTSEQMLQALMDRNKVYDYAFFAGVTSTGIYCRSICSAKKPLPKNVRFFRLRREAELAGFRACKRCRPDFLKIISTSIAMSKNFDFDWILSFLKFRAVTEIEKVSPSSYKRSLHLEEGPVTIEITRDGDQIKTLITKMFDVDANLNNFYKLVRSNKKLSTLVNLSPGIRLPRYLDAFERAIRAILGQQVSVAGARTTTGRFIEKFGGYAPILDGETFRLFPRAPNHIQQSRLRTRASPPYLATRDSNSERGTSLMSWENTVG